MNASEIASLLRRQICSGRFILNEKLPTQRTLASRFGVARGTVREALKRLEEIGVVVRRARSGTYVTYSGHDHIPAIFEFAGPLELIDARLALEPHMVRLAALHADDLDLIEIEADLVLLKGSRIDAQTFADADERFHLGLARCSRNPLINWMTRTFQRVRGHAQWAKLRTLTLEPASIELFTRQHRAIANAVRAGDADLASHLMKEHLETARRSLIAAAIPSTTPARTTFENPRSRPLSQPITKPRRRRRRSYSIRQGDQQ